MTVYYLNGENYRSSWERMWSGLLWRIFSVNLVFSRGILSPRCATCSSEYTLGGLRLHEDYRVLYVLRLNPTEQEIQL